MILYKIKRKLMMWLGSDKTDRWLTVAVVVGWTLVILTMLMVSLAKAHDIHFSDVNNQPIVCTWQDNDLNRFMCYEDGRCYMIYKAVDLTHGGLHVKEVIADCGDTIIQQSQ